MWQEIISVIVSNGVFAILFVGLFCYQLKDSKRREEKYQQTIEKLTNHVGIVEDIKKDVEIIKEATSPKKRRKSCEKVNSLI